jgi:hypothetical protein
MEAKNVNIFCKFDSINTLFMEKAVLQKMISKSIQSADNELLIRIINVIDMYNSNQEKETVLSDEQLIELDSRRNRYLSGAGNTYSWDEVQHELKKDHGISS